MKPLFPLAMAMILAISFADAKPKPKPKSLNAGPDQTINAGESVNLVGTSVGINTFYWATSGTGTFSNQTKLSTVYYPSQADIASGNVRLTLSEKKKKPKFNDSMNLSIQSCGSVNAGPDISICAYAGGQLQLQAVAEGYESIAWSTSGWGDFDDPTSPTPVYYYHEGDINLENILISVVVQDGNCYSSDTVNVSLQRAPLLEFPEPYVQEIDYVGVNASVNISGPVSSGMWTTTGTGYFSDPGATSSAYYPSTDDRSKGCAELIFTTDDPDGICGPASGSMSACFTPIVDCPSIYIGEDQTVCASYGGGGAISLSAAINGSADGFSWSTNGTGWFEDPTNPHTTYWIDGNDVNNAQIEIYGNISAGGNCSTSDAMTVYLNSAPELVFPEPWVYSCENTPIYVNVYLYGYASSGSWSTSGAGYFADANSNYTIYYPQVDEVGTYQLTFTTNDPDGPCWSTSGYMEVYYEDCYFEDGSSEAISLSPNPATDQIKVNTKLKIKKSETYITDTRGKRTACNWQGETINVSGLQTGPHILHTITDKGKAYRIRFMKL